jgi:hypothetical protein
MASLIPGYEYDIFISYRQKDNKYDGWVTEFVDNLKRELESMFKDEVSVYFDINPSNYLLESHDVDASLKDKLRCLIFIPIISRTYCDPKAFAWDNELKVFINETSVDRFGFKVKLSGGNVANRVLPIRIHDLDASDIKLFESVVGGVMRSIDFVYKETGVNRQLRAKDDDIMKGPGQVLYRDQINKVALAIREIIEHMKVYVSSYQGIQKEIQTNESEEKKEIKVEGSYVEEIIKPEQEIHADKTKPGKEKIFQLLRRPGILIPLVLGVVAIFAAIIFLPNRHAKTLIGKWEIQSRYVEAFVNNVFINDTTYIFGPGDISIEFKDNLTGYVYEKGMPGEQFTWSVNDTTLLIIFPGQSPYVHGFKISEPALTFNTTSNEKYNYPKIGDSYKEVWHFKAKRR